jgi:hypothetical protein
MALVCSAMADWVPRHLGPSRYALWLFPLLVLVICDVLSRLRSGWPWRRSVANADGRVHGARGASARRRYQHSGRHGRVLRLRPRYNPTHEIFIERTAHADWTREGLTGPYVFTDDGRCRKALAQKKHAQALEAQCGAVPPAFTRFVAEVKERGGGRGEWVYVDY